ncbi:translation initiation factor IF-3 [Spiroplasma endosymbiont of Agriotes lineatus]|uniref:translation initiation factor IF-3 n=1 Tax=Spiroplasma endosymbiont of Agriotes lineatus TaxID=3077930 RepID=UPI0030CB35E3
MKYKPNNDLINQNIPFCEVLVIDQNGNQLGVMLRNDALRAAKEQGLDLFIVSPNVNPPVSKILDYGRYKYEEQKKDKDNKKKQRIIQNKEMRLTPNIGEHDLRFKAKKVIEFLKDGDRVKISLKFRGRESHRKEFGYETLMRFYDLVKEYCEIEKTPKLTGQFYDMYLIAKKDKDLNKKKEQKNAKNENKKSITETN